MMNNNLPYDDVHANNNGNSIHPRRVSRDSTTSDDVHANNNGNIIHPPEVSGDSTTSDGAVNGRDNRSLFQQVAGPTMVSVSTMTATNPADPYNPLFFMD